MARFELRDISQKLGAAASADSVVSSLLATLESVQRDWRAGLAFYECSTDRLVNYYSLEHGELRIRDLDLSVQDLPTRLVRKFFHHAMVAQNLRKRLVLSLIFRNSPFYRFENSDREVLAEIVPIDDWKSCICFPLADAEDVFAMIVLASRKRNAFPSRAVGEVLPITSVAAMALAQHLYRAEKGRLEEAVKTAGDRVATQYQEKMTSLSQERESLSTQIEDQTKVINDLLESMSHLDRDSAQYRDELGRVKTALFALEEQSSAATEHLTEAYTELTETNFQITEIQTTAAFMHAVCDLLAQEHDERQLPYVLIQWFCDYFGIDRFSLMMLEPPGETMTIAFSRGINETVTRRVRMRVGQGIAGWVAHNRKPLLVQSKGESAVPHTGQDDYNSDSFLSVPVVVNDVLYGVLNFSNKRDGSVFVQEDLDRATFLTTFLGMAFRHTHLGRRAA